MTTPRHRAGWLMGALFWSAAGAGVVACPICFQIEQGPVTDGVRAAVVVLMGVTVAVLAVFGVFVKRMASADRAAASANLRNPGTSGTSEPRNPGTSLPNELGARRVPSTGGTLEEA